MIKTLHSAPISEQLNGLIFGSNQIRNRYRIIEKVRNHWHRLPLKNCAGRVVLQFHWTHPHHPRNWIGRYVNGWYEIVDRIWHALYRWQFYRANRFFYMYPIHNDSKWICYTLFYHMAYTFNVNNQQGQQQQPATTKNQYHNIAKHLLFPSHLCLLFWYTFTHVL